MSEVENAEKTEKKWNSERKWKKTNRDFRKKRSRVVGFESGFDPVSGFGLVDERLKSGKSSPFSFEMIAKGLKEAFETGKGKEKKRRSFGSFLAVFFQKPLKSLDENGSKGH